MERKHGLAQMADRLTEAFKLVVVGEVDDYCAYLPRIQGTYLYHQHPKDETYLVLEGAMAVDHDGVASVTLSAWESLVVKADTRHSSRSEQGALVVRFKARDLFAE